MKRSTNARPLFAGLASLLSSAAWLVAFGLLSGTAQYLAMMGAAICTVLYLSGAAAVTQDVVHPGLWAISYSICVIVQNLLGSSTGPIVVGALSDRFGLQKAMLTVPLLPRSRASSSSWQPSTIDGIWRRWTRWSLRWSAERPWRDCAALHGGVCSGFYPGGGSGGMRPRYCAPSPCVGGIQWRHALTIRNVRSTVGRRRHRATTF